MCALPKDSLEAMATLFFSSRSVSTWKSSSAVRAGRVPWGYTSVSDLGWLETLPSLRSVLLTDDQPIAPEDLRPLVPAHVEVAYAP